ncbi:MAG: flavodoxin-dependent (E)-4-hydroxy-3-methylbut-2-enyl-diphosphate synthase, partial [Planctomycetota bacterium]
VSCPTCGRCRVDLVRMVEAVQARLRHVRAPLRVAVMGCEVNGPGEASEAGAGLAAGRGRYTLFQAGKRVRAVPEEEALDALCRAVEAIAAQGDLR